MEYYQTVILSNSLRAVRFEWRMYGFSSILLSRKTDTDEERNRGCFFGRRFGVFGGHLEGEMALGNTPGMDCKIRRLPCGKMKLNPLRLCVPDHFQKWRPHGTGGRTVWDDSLTFEVRPSKS